MSCLDPPLPTLIAGESFNPLPLLSPKAGETRATAQCPVSNYLVTPNDPNEGGGEGGEGRLSPSSPPFSPLHVEL